MGPDSFLSDVHSLIDKFGEDRARGAREVGIWGSENWHAPFLLFPQPRARPLAIQPPLHRAQGKARGPVHRGAPPSCHSLLCHFQWSCPYIQLLPSLSCPSLELGFLGAIFPSSPRGCEHPGIREHDPGIWVMGGLRGCGWTMGLRARQGEQLCCSAGHPYEPLTQDQTQTGRPGACAE